MSGYGYMIGLHKDNISVFNVKSKTCSTCARVNTLNITPEEHCYQINWEGTIRGMETGLALELFIHLHNTYEYPVYIECIVSDNALTICSHLEH